MWKDLPTPIIIGHRGDEACAPENTLSAFKQAADKGADAIEFDVELTKDDHVIVFHDKTVERTTNGSGEVAQLSFAALRDLDASVKFPGPFSNEKIPTLDEVFETVGNRLYMNIEIKNFSLLNDTLVQKVTNSIKKHGMQERVLLSSFLSFNLQKARQFLPGISCGLLTLPGWKGSWGRTFGWRGDTVALHPHFADVDAILVNQIHSAGKQVNIWTVREEEDIKRMVHLGVDGIITSDLALTLRLLGRGT
jgi:glycerophosphoryl diester phosphodiesterase